MNYWKKKKKKLSKLEGGKFCATVRNFRTNALFSALDHRKRGYF